MRLAFAIFLLALFWSTSGHAHKIRVFAWAEQDIITVEGAFSGGRKLARGIVSVINEQTGETIITGKTDEQGLFIFTVSEAMKNEKPAIKIQLSGGDGHQNHWLMQPADYLATDEKIAHIKPKVIQQEIQETCLNETEMTQLLNQLLEAKLAPMRRSLAAAIDPSPGPKEIFGGIGYLVGLAGIVAWLRSRKEKNSQKNSTKGR